MEKLRRCGTRRCRFGEGSGQMDESGRVKGPVEGVPGIIMAGFDLGRVGYTLEEVFLEGTATSFEPVGHPGEDGRWAVTPSGPAPVLTPPVRGRPAHPRA